VGQGGDDLGRLTVNIWGFGVIDIATQAGIPKGDEDFGQTFGYWGIPQGPYLFVR
jgi:phospholipid-binding lipoprotein MlaA